MHYLREKNQMLLPEKEEKRRKHDFKMHTAKSQIQTAPNTVTVVGNLKQKRKKGKKKKSK